MENFEQPHQEENPETLLKKEKFENLCTLFDEAETMFESKGRDETKPLLGNHYANLGELNKSTEEINPLRLWNPTGDLTEDQFNELNLRRKILSNAIGVKTASGIRHDLNEV